MSERAPARGAPGYVVLRHCGGDRWQLVGEADRRPGHTARRARAQAVVDATGRAAKAGEAYAVVPRSEWRVALDH
jgi:hypothetical protein